jgi:hypothetical protein
MFGRELDLVYGWSGQATIQASHTLNGLLTKPSSARLFGAEGGCFQGATGEAALNGTCANEETRSGRSQQHSTNDSVDAIVSSRINRELTAKTAPSCKLQTARPPAKRAPVLGASLLRTSANQKIRPPDHALWHALCPPPIIDVAIRST